MNGVDALPPVQGALGELAAHAAIVEGLVRAQEANCEVDSNGAAWPGKAELYANMTLQPEIYSKMLNMVRDLSGGGLIQLPSSHADFKNPSIAADLNRYVQSPGTPSQERVKLMKLVWDIVGSEFASRHHQYEMFYAGAPFVVKGHMYRNYDFDGAKALVESALSGYDLEGRKDLATERDLAGR